MKKIFHTALKLQPIDSNIEVIEGTTKLAEISGTKPSVDLLTYTEMTQGYFSGCSETTNICRSEFTRFPDSSAVVIHQKKTQNMKMVLYHQILILLTYLLNLQQDQKKEQMDILILVAVLSLNNSYSYFSR